MASDFSSYLYKQMGSLFIVWSIWNLQLCSGIFDSENFETCEIFLQNVQPNSSKYSDITHDIIEHLQLKQTRPQSLIIRNELSLRYIQPDILGRWSTTASCMSTSTWKRYIFNDTFTFLGIFWKSGEKRII